MLHDAKDTNSAPKPYCPHAGTLGFDDCVHCNPRPTVATLPVPKRTDDGLDVERWRVGQFTTWQFECKACQDTDHEFCTFPLSFDEAYAQAKEHEALYHNG